MEKLEVGAYVQAVYEALKIYKKVYCRQHTSLFAAQHNTTFSLLLVLWVLGRVLPLYKELINYFNNLMKAYQTSDLDESFLVLECWVGLLDNRQLLLHTDEC